MQIDLRCGDCLEIMQSIPNGSVDLTVTSPPYDNLRAYNGYSFDFEGAARELFRVTKSGGVVVWIVNDATVKGSETGTSFRQALYFKEIGFNLHDTMIWKKPNPLPLNHRRYEQSFEYMFVFSQGRPVTANMIKTPCKHAGKKSSGTIQKSDNGVRSRKAHYHVYSDTKTKANIWDFVNINKTSHPAVFPEKLAHDHIVSWSNPGDTVLDPFTGSGTTGVACVNLGRKFIGIEQDVEYFEAAKERVYGALEW